MSRYLFDEASHKRHPLKPMVFVVSSLYEDVDIVDRCIMEQYMSGVHAGRAVFGGDIQPGELGERIFYIPNCSLCRKLYQNLRHSSNFVFWHLFFLGFLSTKAWAGLEV